jgi:hypothetical protein
MTVIHHFKPFKPIRKHDVVKHCTRSIRTAHLSNPLLCLVVVWFGLITLLVFKIRKLALRLNDQLSAFADYVDINSTGFCLFDLYNGLKPACSDCALKYHAALLSSDYGRLKEAPEQFSSLLSSCGVPASSYTYSYTPILTTTSTS